MEVEVWKCGITEVRESSRLMIQIFDRERREITRKKTWVDDRPEANGT